MSENTRFFVPETLQSIDHWILWRHENGQKQPYSAKYNGHAKTNDARGWASYEDARLRLQRGGYDGLGFVFTEHLGMVFIDLDHCIESGEITSSTAANTVELLRDKSYIEISQSGNGLHLVCRGEIPKSCHREDIEIYDKGRYMAFTGNALTDIEPTNAQQQLDALCKTLGCTADQQQEDKDGTLKEEKDIAEITIPTQMTAADKRVIEKARQGKNREWFTQLWSGNWRERHDYLFQGQWELMNLLYYYTSHSEKQTLRLYRMSNLEKGNERQIQRTFTAVKRNEEKKRQRR